MRRSVTILLVEDDPAMGAATLEALTMNGHAPILATGVREAFELLISPHRFEVVILDLQLRTDRGESLVQQMLAAKVILPRIVVLSAQPMRELIRAAKAVGAEAYLQKPCSSQRILEAIELAMV